MSDERGTWHFVDSETGQPNGRTYTGRRAELEANTPRKCTAVAGPIPVQQHDESGGALPRNVVREIGTSRAAHLQIKQLEASQNRSMRELALNPGDQAARQRVKDIDNQIAALRPIVNAPDVPESDHGPRLKKV